MLFIGQRCSHDACNLVDFLPLKCQYCHQPFCGSHFSLSTHTCPNRPPEYTLNRVAPLCPLCSTPISALPGEDPNIPMERHIGSECRGKEEKKDELRRKREKGEVCWKKGCGKVLFAKIRCEACKHDFCAPHRYPNQHVCPSLSSSSSSTTPPPTAKQSQLDSKLAGVNSSNPLLAKLRAKQAGGNAAASSSSIKPGTTNTKSPAISTATSSNTKAGVSSNSLTHLPFGARRDAALAAMKRLGQSSNTTSTHDSSSSTSAAGVGKPIGSGEDKMDMASLKRKFQLGPSTTDKQAAAELASMFKSLENRHKKGLLNETEKVQIGRASCRERVSR